MSKSGFEFVYFEGPAVLTAMDQKQAVFIFLLFLCALIFQIGGANLKIYDDKGTHSTCTISTQWMKIYKESETDAKTAFKVNALLLALKHYPDYPYGSQCFPI